MGGGDIELGDEIVFPGDHAHAALAAPALAAVDGQGGALDVAPVADGHHHLLIGDEVFGGEFLGLGHDFGAPAVAVAFLELGQLLGDEGLDLGLFRQDLAQAPDGGPDLFGLIDDLLTLQAGEALQPHFQDGLGLDLGKGVAAAGSLPGWRQARPPG